MSNCLCKVSDVMLFSCSGAANVGQIANYNVPVCQDTKIGFLR